MSKKTDFNGLVEFKVYDGDQLYKLGFKVDLSPQEPYHRGAVNRLFYMPVQAVLNPEFTSEGDQNDHQVDVDFFWPGVSESWWAWEILQATLFRGSYWRLS